MNNYLLFGLPIMCGLMYFLLPEFIAFWNQDKPVSAIPFLKVFSGGIMAVTIIQYIGYEDCFKWSTFWVIETSLSITLAATTIKAYSLRKKGYRQ